MRFNNNSITQNILHVERTVLVLYMLQAIPFSGKTIIITMCRGYYCIGTIGSDSKPARSRRKKKSRRHGFPHSRRSVARVPTYLYNIDVSLFYSLF